MQILAISGHARNGKDTLADMIKSHLEEDGFSVLITHYADLLKYVCKTFFNWDGAKDENGRHILQYVGTDIIRYRSPNYWVDFIIDMLTYFGDNWDWVIIPDTRFPNEIDRLKKSGFSVIHLAVVRDDFDNGLTEEQKSHPSETALDNVIPDYEIHNNGTLPELEQKALKLIEDIKKDSKYRGISPNVN